MRRIFITGFLALISVSAAANDNIKYVCSNDSVERTVEVVYTTPGSALPCEVQYTKDGQTQVLWSFQNETGKCEAQAASFVEKQTGWGWQCSTDSIPASQTPSEAETAPVPDVTPASETEEPPMVE